MRKFKNVSTYAGVAPETNAYKLIACAEEYSRHFLSSNVKGYKYEDIVKDKTFAQKTAKINELYLAEISRRSKTDIADYDGSVIDYATDGKVIKMQAFLNKILLDAITPIFINASGLNMLAEMHYGGYGDVFKFQLRDNSNYSVSKMGRRQKHTKIQEKKKNNKTITMDYYGLSTMSTLPQIMLGESMIAEDMVRMALSMTAKIYRLTIKKFISACETITDTRILMTSYTETGLLTALRNGSAFNGSTMVIVGDAVACKTILPENTQTRIFLQDEYNTTLGYMSTFNTYKVLVFDVVRDDEEDTGILGLPTNRLYGISTGLNGKVIHVGIGSTLANTDDTMENDNLGIITTLRKELGVELATTQKVLKVELV
jgi:hypothetical protein